MVKRYDFIARSDEFQMEFEGEPRESKTGKYVLYADYEAHNWMADYCQKLRNAIADCIPLGEPCGDQALIDYPAKMKAELSDLRGRLEEAEEILNHVNLQFPLEDYGLDVLEDVRGFLATQPGEKGIY